MARFEDVARLAADLSDVTSGERRGRRTRSVGSTVFAWERPLTKADIGRLEDVAPPSGSIPAVRVADLGEEQAGEEEAVLAACSRAVFTIPLFDDFAAVLVLLHAVGEKTRREFLLDGWLARAPRPLAPRVLAGHDASSANI